MTLNNTPNIPDDLSTSIGVIQRQPTNTNPLNNTSFRFHLNRTPNLTWFVQNAALPGLALGNSEQPTYFVPIKRPGNVQFEDLTIEFIIDEDMKTWKEIFDWIKYCSNIKDFEDYDKNKIYSDATLEILSNKMNRNVVVNIKNMFPVALSGINFEGTATEPDAVTASVTFAFTHYDIVLKDCV